jgi:hypothetical protein
LVAIGLIGLGQTPFPVEDHTVRLVGNHLLTGHTATECDIDNTLRDDSTLRELARNVSARGERSHVGSDCRAGWGHGSRYSDRLLAQLSSITADMPAH